MIYTDLPIQNTEEDELNRVEFAKNLGYLINNYKNEESLVLSLMGGWGSGKTSLINLTLNELDKNIIIKFDPWLFSEQKNLILNFFNELSYGLKAAELENDSKLKDVSDNLRKIAKFIKPDTFSVSINPLNIVSITAEYENDNNEQSDESLEKFKNEINNDLKGLERRKIVIVIDNIDRLNKSEVKEIFQLVKSLADFKNIIYILSFDKEVVLESLDGYVSSPEVFLEKIIQIPINIPQIEDYRLQEYFQKELKELLKTKEITIDNKSFITISYSLSFFFENIRDVKRYLNNLNFYLDMVKSEVNIEDYLLSLALQIFEFDIYHEIRSNKSLFTGRYNSYTIDQRSTIEAETLKQNIKTIFDKNKRLNNENIKHIFSNLFPNIRHLNNNIIDEALSQKLMNGKKIASPEFFDRYFTLVIPENKISEVIFTEIINSKNIESLEVQYKMLKKEGKSEEFLDKIYQQPSKIPKNNIPLFIDFLLKNEDHIYELKGFLFYRILINLLKIEDDETQFNTIKKYITEDTKLFGPIYLVQSIINRDKILNSEQLAKIKEILLQKIHSVCKSGELLRHPRLYDILCYWSLIESKKVVERFIKDCLKDKNKTIQFIRGFRHTQYALSRAKYDFDNMKKLIDLRYVKEEVDKIKDVENIDDQKELENFKSKLEEYLHEQDIFIQQF